MNAILTCGATEGGAGCWNPGACQSPLDLAACVGRRELAALVCQLAATVAPSDLFPVFSFADARVCSPWTMLGLVTYACALGVGGSEETAQLARQDEAWRSQSQGEIPSGESIRNFRLRNRVMVQDLLERTILMALRRQRAEDAAGTTHRPGGGLPADCASEKDWIACEAQARLRGAEQADRAGAAAAVDFE